MKSIREFLIQPYIYALIVLIGISFKFYRLDYKLFWLDEVYTIQHTSGCTAKDYQKLIPVDEINNIGFYKDLYHLNKQKLSIISQLKGMFSEPQMNPLHYPLLMIWYRIAGDDPADYIKWSSVSYEYFKQGLEQKAVGDCIQLKIDCVCKNADGVADRNFALRNLGLTYSVIRRFWR